VEFLWNNIDKIVQLFTLFAIIFAAWQILFHARQMHRDLEMTYVQQYWRIIGKTSLEWRNTFFSGEPVTTADELAVLQYLQLCEDELDLRRNARVTDSTWAIWATAIAGTIKKKAFVDVLKRSPDGFFKEIELMANSNNPVKYDPLKRSRIWRRIHGL
jgi:hypothetical protein